MQSIAIIFLTKQLQKVQMCRETQSSHAYFSCNGAATPTDQNKANGDFLCRESERESPAGPGEPAKVRHTQQKDSYQYQSGRVCRRGCEGTVFVLLLERPLSLFLSSTRSSALVASLAVIMNQVQLASVLN